MKNSIKQSLIGSFLVLTALSCSKNDDSPTPPTVEKNTVVYMAGYIEVPSGGTTMQKATIWKNGIVQRLSNTESFASKVMVVGTDVYAVGREYEGLKSVAKLWKNGIVSNPISSTVNTEAITFAISASNEVYIAIREWSNLGSEYKVLKNGAPINLNLSNSNNRAFPLDVFVAGNDVYVAGIEHEFATNSEKAVYWKNGEISTLPEISGNDVKAIKIFVSGNDIYVLGEEERVAKSVILLWKNGTPTSITDGTKDASVNALFVSGSDVYTAGDQYDEATSSSVSTLWKNGTAIFSRSEDNITFTSVSLLDNNLFLAGRGYFDGSRSYLWKNGQLESPKIENATVSSVFAVEE